jgi:hypothetical protein
MTALWQVLLLVFCHVGMPHSLKVTTGQAKFAGLPAISAVALHKWMKKLEPYLTDLLFLALNPLVGSPPVCWRDWDVIVADATTICRPGATGTTARLHYALRLATMGYYDLQVTDPSEGEFLRRFRILAGQLWLVDRGYCNPAGLAHVVTAQADVLARLNRGTLPLFTKGGKPWELLSRVRKVKNDWQQKQWTCWVHPAEGDPIRVRVCALRLDAEHAAKARARVLREYGREASEESLEMSGWVLLVTTASARRLPLSDVFLLYRWRWQVELGIKQDKSLGEVVAMPNFRPDTIATWLTAHALLQVLARGAAGLADAIFPPEAVAARAPQGLRGQVALESRAA